MMDKEDILKNVSICISKELERKGHSKHKLDIASWLVRIRENVENRGGNNPLFNTGSNAEGTDVSGSDRDLMVVFPNCEVVADSRDVKFSKEKHVFVMIQDSTRPCYTKLLLLQEGQCLDKESDLFQCLGGKKQLCVEDGNGGYLFSSDNFTKELARRTSEIMQSSANHVLSSFHVHGPCTTFDNTVGKIKFDTDFAYCFHCKTLPNEAVAFRTRSRQHNWPSESLIKKLIDLGCHIVAVGDKSSKTHFVEWRVSFALFERELVWSLNDTQCKCYVILKMLLKIHIDKLAPEELSSYALKTLIFWCAESDDPLFWQEENLVPCVHRCLSKLQTCVSEKRLPHFIVPENNLLATKFKDDKIHFGVTELISQMVNWHWCKLLQCPSLTVLNTVWQEVNHDVKMFLQHASRHPNIAVPFYQDVVTFRALQTLYMDINSYLATSDDMLSTFKSFKETNVDDIGKEILEFGICALTCRMSHILKNSHKVILYERTTVSKTSDKIMTDTIMGSNLPSRPGKYVSINLESVTGCDVCSENLRLALHLLLRGKFAKAEGILENVLKSYKPHVIYIGLCGPEELDLIEYCCYTSSSGKMSILEKAQKLIAFDFTICENDTVTRFLQREQLFWNEPDVPICIHPRVMAYYLCFLSAHGQHQERRAWGYMFPLSMNVEAMYKNKNLFSYIPWNLLGHCYVLRGLYGKAFKAFCNSLKSKPSHNPALYYIAQL